MASGPRSDERNDEALYALGGTGRLEPGPAPDHLESVDVEAASGDTVPRLMGVTNRDVMEASTPHLDDVVLLEDRYGSPSPTS